MSRLISVLYFTALSLLVLASLMFTFLYIFANQPFVRSTLISLKKNLQQKMDTLSNVTFRHSHLKRIVYWAPSNFQYVRGLTELTRLQQCEYINCVMSFTESDLNKSDAVIFNMINMKKRKYNLSLSSLQNPGQIWIWTQHERPTFCDKRSTSGFRSGVRGVFNWTMTFSKRSDIYLPYGVLKVKSQAIAKRDYLKIAQKKIRDALWVSSNCNTEGKRKNYVDILKQYVSVDVLGRCGQKWNCGLRRDHDLDDCFDILNTTYRFYFDFENEHCQEYISEKFYENFDYDILVVSRGDIPGSLSINISRNAYINAGDFKSAHQLGKYLKKLSDDINAYAKMLEEKDKYYVVRYKELFKEAMCEVCKRLNEVDKYKSVYEDVYQWMKTQHRCIAPYDI